jgi:hypothetical protein
MKEKIARLEQWKEDISPILEEICRDIKRLNWKLAVATGVIVGVELIINTFNVDVVEAFYSLIH